MGASEAPRTAGDREARAASALRLLWQSAKGDVLRRVDLLEETAARTGTKRLGALQREAEREAHKLAGSLGTFGFPDGSRLAADIERLLQSEVRPASVEASRLRDLVAELRSELSASEKLAELKRLPAEREPSRSHGPRSEEDIPLVLIVEDDQGLAEKLAAEAAAQGMRAACCRAAEALAMAADLRPDVVLLDLSSHKGEEARRDLLHQLHRERALPVLVMTDKDSFVDRIEIARFGGRGFLHTSLSPAALIEAVMQSLESRRALQGKILAVDDDPLMLDLLRGLIHPTGAEITTLEDPLLFWDVLEKVVPDLLILDVDMPRVNGMDLCRTVRADPRWQQMPVLFLTARGDIATVEAIFQVGADDFVAKPVVGPELVTRITNRLERARLFKSMAETDPLTGVANRRKSSQVLA